MTGVSDPDPHSSILGPTYLDGELGVVCSNYLAINNLLAINIHHLTVNILLINDDSPYLDILCLLNFCIYLHIMLP